MNFTKQVVEDLVDSAGQGEMGAIKQLLRAYKPDINSQNSSGLTSLFVASTAGRPEVVSFLIKLGADVNRRNGAPRDLRQRNMFIEGQTPLHAAAAANHIPILEILLKNGADINAQDRKGQTPLIEAVQFGNPETVEFLLMNNANPEIRTTTFQTAFGIAKAMGKADILGAFQKVARRMTAEVVAAPRQIHSAELPPGFSMKLAEYTVPKGGKRSRRVSKTKRKRKSSKN
jgi:ankyrin repeat protein